MAPDNTKISLYELEQPEKLQNVLAQEKEDCLSCKLTGASAFIGLGAYSYFSGQNQLQKQQAKILASGSRFGMKSRQTSLTVTSLMLVGMGFWRLVH